jgi:uncharacterized paraquat-inducible protein A
MECGKMVDELEDICPYCGAHMPIYKKKQLRRFITIAVTVLSVCVLAAGFYLMRH